MQVCSCANSRANCSRGSRGGGGMPPGRFLIHRISGAARGKIALSHASTFLFHMRPALPRSLHFLASGGFAISTPARFCNVVATALPSLAKQNHAGSAQQDSPSSSGSRHESRHFALTWSDSAYSQGSKAAAGLKGSRSG